MDKFFALFTIKALPIKASMGIVGSLIIGQLGGWGMDMQTLFVFMIVDYLSGVAIAIGWKESNKSNNGRFSSTAGFRGLSKKSFMLFGVWMASQVDLIGGVDFIRTGYIIMLCINEFGSIGENFAIMGVPMPEQVTAIFDVLQNNNKSDQ